MDRLRSTYAFWFLDFILIDEGLQHAERHCSCKLLLDDEYPLPPYSAASVSVWLSRQHIWHIYTLIFLSLPLLSAVKAKIYGARRAGP